MKLKVIIVDDEVLITDLLSMFLNNDPNLEVIASYTSGFAFLKDIEQKKIAPDVLILDYRLGDIDGMELSKKLKAIGVELPIILMSSYYNNNLISFIVKSGFAAFLPKNIKPSYLIEIIQEVSDKGFYLMPEQFDLLRDQMLYKNVLITDNLQLGLTAREKEILYLIAQQETGKEIATELFISLKTVEGHKNNLFIKTGAKNVVGLIVYAVQNKILNIDELSIN